MENKNEQTMPQTQTAGADMIEGERIGQVSLGKFKDVGALINAYNSLQAEFTKRCQRIKELESKALSDDKKTIPSEQAKVQASSQEDTTLADKENILKEYLLDIIGKKPNAILMDGAGVSVKTPINRPKTILEAGNLAKNLFNKKQN